MKKHLFLVLVLLLLCTCTSALLAQEKEEPLTKIPTIIVRGEDKSYLEIIREIEIRYMPYRGEKTRSNIEYGLELPARFPMEMKPLVVSPDFEEEKLIFVVAETKKISPTPALPSLSEKYLGVEKVALHPQRTEKEFAVKEKFIKKTLIHPPLQPPFLIREIYLHPAEPRVSPETAPIAIGQPEQTKLIPREILPVTLSQSYIHDEKTSIPEEKQQAETKTPYAIEVTHKFLQDKQLIRPPIKIPYLERVYFPDRIDRSDYPFLVFSLGGDDASGFNYGVDYGRGDAEKRYFLTLKRDSSPHYAIHQAAPITGETLSREIDILQAGVSWGEILENETTLYLEAAQKNLGLPSAGKRKDTSISFSGKTTISDIWKVGVWGEKATREDDFPTKEQYDDFSYGITLALQPKKSDLLVEAEMNWDNLQQLLPVENGRNVHQALLQLKTLRPISLNENLFLEYPKIGVKSIQGRETQLVGFLRVHWYGKQGLEILFDMNKDFYLPSLANSYMPQDYSQVALDIGGVSMTTYSIAAIYSKSPVVATLKIFSERGEDLVWEYTDLRLNPQITHLAREGVTLASTWHITPSMTLEPAYTWRSIKNLQDADKVIPHQPENILGALLTIDLFERKEDALTFETKAEWLGKRYYTFEAEDILADSSRIDLKLTYRRKNWKVFLGMESTNHSLSKDYKLLEKNLNFGLEVKLF